VRIKPHTLTVPYDLFPSWASGAADEDAGEEGEVSMTQSEHS
jgi:hypothetical protein